MYVLAGFQPGFTYGWLKVSLYNAGSYFLFFIFLFFVPVVEIVLYIMEFTPITEKQNSIRQRHLRKQANSKKKN